MQFRIPANAPARRVTLSLDGREVASKVYGGPGEYKLESAPVRATAATATVEISIDRVFSAPPDRRELGIVVTAAGFDSR